MKKAIICIPTRENFMTTKTDTQPTDSIEAKQGGGGDCVSRLVRLSLSFQPYEVEIIKEALNRMRYEKLSRCPWVKQDNGGYYYQPSKEVKRIQFVENSIKRQLSEPNSAE
jgi:hypothetical protein